MSLCHRGRWLTPRETAVARLSDGVHRPSFKAVVGENRFGADGEWAQRRTLPVQFQNITDNTLARFRKPANAIVIAPACGALLGNLESRDRVAFIRGRYVV